MSHLSRWDEIEEQKVQNKKKLTEDGLTFCRLKRLTPNQKKLKLFCIKERYLHLRNFSYLNKSDSLQCQLTSKEWFEASVGYLYSKVIQRLF